jgi:hypothetical protein
MDFPLFLCSCYRSLGNSGFSTIHLVLGMFLAKSHTTTILIYSGASHSFRSSIFVAKLNLPITIMKYTMLDSSPGGEMKTKHICSTISIAIRGVDFLSNLNIIDSKGIDIILGMIG